MTSCFPLLCCCSIMLSQTLCVSQGTGNEAHNVVLSPPAIIILGLARVCMVQSQCKTTFTYTDACVFVCVCVRVRTCVYANVSGPAVQRCNFNSQLQWKCNTIILAFSDYYLGLFAFLSPRSLIILCLILSVHLFLCTPWLHKTAINPSTAVFIGSAVRQFTSQHHYRPISFPLNKKLSAQH